MLRLIGYSLIGYLVLVSGCAPPITNVSVTKDPNKRFYKSQPIMVDMACVDYLKLEGEFEYQLLAGGYKVTSTAAGVTKTKYHTDMDYNRGKARGGRETYTIQEIPANYVLRISYDHTIYSDELRLYGSLWNLYSGQNILSLKIVSKPSFFSVTGYPKIDHSKAVEEVIKKLDKIHARPPSQSPIEGEVQLKKPGPIINVLAPLAVVGGFIIAILVIEDHQGE